MHDDVRRLVEEIASREAELRERLLQQQEHLRVRVEGRRVEFAEELRAAHRRARVGLLVWLARSDWRNALSAPFIYALIVPFALLDLFLSVYQAVCFRLYRLPRVPRADYIAIDRHHLTYLNALQKLNCIYCGYVNGLIAWAREIASVTEQYWCPVKHARKVLGTHRRYARFLDYGDADAYPVRVLDLRDEVRSERPPGNDQGR